MLLKLLLALLACLVSASEEPVELAVGSVEEAAIPLEDTFADGPQAGILAGVIGGILLLLVLLFVIQHAMSTRAARY